MVKVNNQGNKAICFEVDQSRGVLSQVGSEEAV